MSWERYTLAERKRSTYDGLHVGEDTVTLARATFKNMYDAGCRRVTILIDKEALAIQLKNEPEDFAGGRKFNYQMNSRSLHKLMPPGRYQNQGFQTQTGGWVFTYIRP